MATMEALSEAFLRTFDDKIMRGTEQKALRALLAVSALDRDKRNALTARFYEWAGNTLGKGRDQQVLQWLKTANQLLSEALETPPQGAETYFSPGPDCLGAIQHALTRSRKTLDICVFTISDDRIRDTLLTRKLMGVQIRILTDNEKLLDEGSDITALAKAGIPVRVDRTMNHMHHKFAIFDNALVLTGSYNWTRSAEAHNHENVLLTRDPGTVARFRDTFDKLWKEMKPF